MTSVNITINKDQYAEYCSNGVLTSDELATLAKAEGVSDTDLALALNGGSLSITFDAASGTVDIGDETDLTIDLGNANVKYLTINDNGLDLAINENSSNTMYVFRNANAGSVKSSDGTYSAQLTMNGAGGGSDYIYNATTFELGSVETGGATDGTYYTRNFNIKSDVNVSGGGIFAASLMSINGSQDITQSDDEGNIDGIIKVNINATSNVATDLNYDVQLADTINAGLDSLGALAAGLEVHINNSDTMKVVAGSRVSAKVNSTLGDTQSESFSKQLRTWGEKNADKKFTYNGKEYTAIELADILDGKSGEDAKTALTEALAAGNVKMAGDQQGEVTYQAKEGSWINAPNATGLWHGNFTFTTKLAGQNNPPNFASTTQNGGGNFFLAPEAVEALNALGSHKWEITENGTVTIDGKPTLDGYSFTDAEKAIIGGTYTEQMVTNDNTLHLVDGDSFSLHLGADTLTDGGTVGSTTCRFCDPVAMIYIDNIGNSGGSLFAETINTAEIHSLGKRALDGNTFELNGVAADGIQFQTGIVVKADLENAVTGNVTQDIQLIGTQDRSGAKIIGKVVNQAGKKTATSTYNNLDGLMGNGQNIDLSSQQIMDELNLLLQTHVPPISLMDVDDWLADSEILAFILNAEHHISLPNSVAVMLIQKLMAGTMPEGISDEDIVKLLSSQLSASYSNPLLEAWLTEQVTNSDTTNDSLILAFLNNSSTCEKMSDIILNNLTDSDTQAFVLNHWEKNDSVYTIIVEDVKKGNLPQPNGSILLDKIVDGISSTDDSDTDNKIFLKLADDSELDGVDGGNPLYKKVVAEVGTSQTFDEFLMKHLSGASRSEGLQACVLTNIKDAKIKKLIQDELRIEAKSADIYGMMFSFILDVAANGVDWISTGSRIYATGDEESQRSLRSASLLGLTGLLFEVFGEFMTGAGVSTSTEGCSDKLYTLWTRQEEGSVRQVNAGAAYNMVSLMDSVNEAMKNSGIKVQWDVTYKS